HTLPVFIGVHRAKIYHFCLIIGAFLAMTAYVAFQDFRLSNLLFWLSLPLFAIHLKQVSRSQGRALDPQLKVLSLSTLLFALLAGIGFVI
ncbi:MAG: 1,4-dihydroxy-2-naphthoate octaprenyltransferase, partial [Odoribacter sp.]|nr:1,4-dihydroxy-2-naphthoate octaprenyltransferase [Odoribacter sp.]